VTGPEGLHDMSQHDQLDERRRRNIRRTTIVLALVALGIYVAFIASSVLKAQP
jgi:hypothetical protein